MKLVIIAIVAIFFLENAVSVENSLEDRWESYKQQFHKSYASRDEEDLRFKNWQESLKFIEHHNSLVEKGLKSFTVGESRFSDMTNEEYRKSVLMTQDFDSKITRQGGIPHAEYVKSVKGKYAPIPDNVDWREVGAVSAIKDQKNCGSCFSFAANAALESHWKLYEEGHNLGDYSEQEIVDCSIPEGNLGCAGGLAENCYRYVKRNGRVSTTAAYPYKAEDGVCQNLTDSESFGAKLYSFVYTKDEDEIDMKDAVARVGPISIHLDAGADSFHSYKPTDSYFIYDEDDCSRNSSNHAMLAVGYGTSASGDYWIIKNSWGVDWGDNGYIFIRRGKNTCAIGYYGGEYPVVTMGGNSEKSFPLLISIAAVLSVGHFLTLN